MSAFFLFCKMLIIDYLRKRVKNKFCYITNLLYLCIVKLIKKNSKNMKTTVNVTMTDNFSGRSLTFRTTRSKWESALENGKWDWMSDGQRKKAEDFFGKMAAYYTSVEAE